MVVPHGGAICAGQPSTMHCFLMVESSEEEAWSEEEGPEEVAWCEVEEEEGPAEEAWCGEEEGPEGRSWCEVEEGKAWCDIEGNETS